MTMAQPETSTREAVTLADVEDAARLIAGHVRETPVVPAGELGRRLGARVVLKAENLQLTGSFKARGATNTIRRLPGEALAAGGGGGGGRRPPPAGGGPPRAS